MRRNLVLTASVLSIMFSTVGGAMAQWVHSPPPGTQPVRCIAVKGANLFANFDNYGVFLSTDSGATWKAPVNTGLPPDGPGYYIQALAVIDTILFAAASSHDVFRSTDNGANWTAASNGLPDSGVFSLAVRGHTLFAITWKKGVYRSTDNGGSWTPANSGLVVVPAFMGLVANDNSLFGYSQDSGVFRWSEQDERWSAINSGLTAFDVSALAVNGTNLYATAYDGIFFSTNNGTSWHSSNTLMTGDTGVHALMAIGSNLLLGTSNFGVLLSTDKGASWADFNTGHGKTQVDVLSMNGTYLFEGDYVGGVWRRPLSEMIGTNAVAEHTAQAPAVVQSYPNPFTHSTTIRFSPAERGYAEVTVVNLLGEQVARLFEGELEAGEHNLSWSPGGALPNGMYECFIRRNGQVDRLTMSVLR